MSVFDALRFYLVALKSGDDGVVASAAMALAEARRMSGVRKMARQAAHLALD
jgi:hypothetical protein